MNVSILENNTIKYRVEELLKFSDHYEIKTEKLSSSAK
jgi:hypothetical protein